MAKEKVPHSEQFNKIKGIVSPELHQFINEHHTTWLLMDKVNEENNEEIYQEILRHISNEIDNHFKLEENIILPRLQKYISISDVGPINKLIAEHISIKNKYDDVTSLIAQNGLNEEVKKQVKLLAYLVKKHIEKEEHFFFPLVSLILNKSEMSEIKKELENIRTV